MRPTKGIIMTSMNVTPEEILNLSHNNWAKGFITGAMLGMGTIFVINSGRVKVKWRNDSDQKDN